MFLPVRERVLALCFGHVGHNLLDESYEYDFGLRTTLNCVDPTKLKNTDVAEPGSARRRRTQLTVSSDITFFDLERDSTVLRSLTGLVRAEYADVIGQATGSTSLRIGSKVTASGLEKLGETLLEIYEREDYKTTFADIQNVTPVREPAAVEALNTTLTRAFGDNAADLLLAMPEIVDYALGFRVSFSGAGGSQVYEEILIDAYREYLTDHHVDPATLTVDDLKRHHVEVLDENSRHIRTHSIYRCLLFDAELSHDDGAVYHLVEGQWYRVDRDFVRALTTYLDTKFEELDLPACDLRTEGEYNESVADGKDFILCLDKKDISPATHTQVEPCDVFALRDDRARLTHVKISTDAPALSHLFNQGANAVELLKSEPEARSKLSKLLAAEATGVALIALREPVDAMRFEVVYAIITTKDAARRSRNLPLFSRISLRRSLKSLEVMGIPASFGFIDDTYGRAVGRKKPRKPRASRQQT